jgi:hypothetical protein
MHHRGIGLLCVTLLLTACVRSDVSDTGAGTGEATSSTANVETGDTTDDSTDSSGDTGDTTGDTGELPPNCGWNGSGYACSVMGADPDGTPLPCPGDQEAGPCSSADALQSCCDADGNAWACICDGQACDYSWTMTDCAHAAGAGTCGWWSDWSVYSCGGEGEDPNGTPIACVPGLVAGEPCDPIENPPCCDTNGDEWECVLDPFQGTAAWAVWDC